MGRDMRAIGELLAGILLTLTGAGHTVLAVTGKRPALMVTISAATLLTGIAMMLLTRDTIRRLSLDLAGYQTVNWVAPQWGPITIFFVLLVVALGTVVWMARALATAGRQP
jgi:ribose/xylose/arabinose/galactoside ABC-type transport system permease subunit